jgi:hypothetical protein
VTVTERLARMEANHYRSSADFQRDQASRLADALWQVIHALDVGRVGPDDPVDPGDGVLFGMWRVSDVVAAARK